MRRQLHSPLSFYESSTQVGSPAGKHRQLLTGFNSHLRSTESPGHGQEGNRPSRARKSRHRMSTKNQATSNDGKNKQAKTQGSLRRGRRRAERSADRALSPGQRAFHGWNSKTRPQRDAARSVWPEERPRHDNTHSPEGSAQRYSTLNSILVRLALVLSRNARRNGPDSGKMETPCTSQKTRMTKFDARPSPRAKSVPERPLSSSRSIGAQIQQALSPVDILTLAFPSANQPPDFLSQL